MKVKTDIKAGGNGPGPGGYEGEGNPDCTYPDCPNQ
jgi:hypothetical protein